ncbi:hypothetical protein B0H13DRAFT_1891816 [Mycena leptocephala]|nr:hypothetical protein B0H13DRAFT_1891816 [Mycena leptocephala]
MESEVLEVQQIFDSTKALSLQRWYLHLFRRRRREDRLCIHIPLRRAKRLTVGIFRVPHILSPKQYTQKIHPMLDKSTALPSMQKTYQKFDLNTLMDDHIRPLSHPAPELVILRREEGANYASVIEFAKDAEAWKLLLGARQDFAFQLSANSFLFTADVNKF